jgi:hypothetical protein
MQKIFRTPGFGTIRTMRPDFCITTNELMDGYERSLHPQQRYYDEKMVEAGWDNIMHKGAPIVSDPYYDKWYTDNSERLFDALNLRFLHLRSHSKFNFTQPRWLDREVVGRPDDMVANTRWRGVMYTTNRQMHVRHTGLTPPA